MDWITKLTSSAVSQWGSKVLEHVGVLKSFTMFDFGDMRVGLSASNQKLNLPYPRTAIHVKISTTDVLMFVGKSTTGTVITLTIFEIRAGKAIPFAPISIEIAADGTPLRFGPAVQNGAYPTSIPTDVWTDKAAVCISILQELLFLLHSKSVTVRDITPASKLNKKRRAKGLRPLLAYKVVTLVVPTPMVQPSEHKGGHHASPVLHTRRGHYRKYRSGKVAWVPAMLVGSKTGLLTKDYAVVANKEDRGNEQV